MVAPILLRRVEREEVAVRFEGKLAFDAHAPQWETRARILEELESLLRRSCGRYLSDITMSKRCTYISNSSLVILDNDV